VPQIRNFSEAQDALRPYYHNSRQPYTLDTMRALLSNLGNPQNQLRVVHVAGTSGKTSTAYYCAALLQTAGKTVGLSVSPHVDTVNERLQVNGSPLPEAEFCAVLGEFIDIVDGSNLQPSYFELMVAMAYWEFARRRLDYAVMEVGLGGLLDGTNVVDSPNKICLITDIGYDHTEILGETLSKIATQKAGIIQGRNTVFMYEQTDEVLAAVKLATHQHRATLLVMSAEHSKRYEGLPLFQQRNLGLATQAMGFALQRDFGQELSDDQVHHASHVVVPARLERFKVGDKLVIVDGSHNQQKLHTLLESIAELYPGQDIAALCAFVQGSEERWQGGVTELCSVVKRLIITGFNNEQDTPKSSVSPAIVAAYCDQVGYRQTEVMTSPLAAYNALLLRSEPVLLVTGSFYLLNHIRPLIKEQS
jgi:dihydrofolate synthase/folylpolyglutamate synthase